MENEELKNVDEIIEKYGTLYGTRGTRNPVTNMKTLRNILNAVSDFHDSHPLGVGSSYGLSIKESEPNPDIVNFRKYAAMLDEKINIIEKGVEELRERNKKFSTIDEAQFYQPHELHKMTYKREEEVKPNGETVVKETTTKEPENTQEGKPHVNPTVKSISSEAERRTANAKEKVASSGMMGGAR